jgi:hypothetical protein
MTVQLVADPVTLFGLRLRAFSYAELVTDGYERHEIDSMVYATFG